MTITERMYRALLGTNTTRQGAQAAAHVAAQLQAAAWDDGYAVGQTDYETTRTNPYREDEP